ncbi:hypothetical protein [Thiomicrorhabdus chilensis]|uniref:hypothetical protein n=1 Tax=Thiomicrorhabdus chilensis TaxID=63656 RepID=UPI00041785ED|nr:hypothetical protein [Thiomicrorhabdus chilensis]
MTGTVIVRLEAIKTTGNLTHDLDNSRRPNYVDHSRSHLNKIVMGQKFKESKSLFKHQKKNVIQHFNTEKARLRELITPENLDEKEYLKERRRIRNWQSHMKNHLAGFIGFGRNAQANDLNHDEMDACAKDYVNSFCKRRNVEVLYLVRHMDETTVHYHFVTTNYNPELKQTIRLTRDNLRKEQDMIGHAFSSMGLTRGLDKQERLKQVAQKLNQPMQNGNYSPEVWKESNVIHRSVKQLHEGLPLEIEEKQKEAEKIQSEINAQQKKLEKNVRLITQNETKLKELSNQEASHQVQIEKIEKRLQHYEERVIDAQAEIERLSLELQPIKATRIDYVKGYEEKWFGSPKPIIKKAKVVSPKLANEQFKALKAKEIKLEQEQRRLKQQRQQAQAEQLKAEAELQAFFARQSHKHMMVFGKPVDSNEEFLDFIKWFDQKSGWVTTNIGTRFKVQEQNGQVIRVVVENTESKTAYEKAYTLLLATHKSKLDQGFFEGSDEVFIEFYKLITKKPEKYDFELMLTPEQEALLINKKLLSVYENEPLDELNR